MIFAERTTVYSLWPVPTCRPVTKRWRRIPFTCQSLGRTICQSRGMLLTRKTWVYKRTSALKVHRVTRSETVWKRLSGFSWWRLYDLLLIRLKFFYKLHWCPIWTHYWWFFTSILQESPDFWRDHRTMDKIRISDCAFGKGFGPGLGDLPLLYVRLRPSPRTPGPFIFWR